MKNRSLKSMFNKGIINKGIINKGLINKIVNNKITLYVVAFVAFLSLFRHIMNSEFTAVLLFFLSGAIVYNFTKNMTLVLGTAFVVTIIASMTKNLLGFQEGLTDKTKTTEEEGAEEPKEPEEPKADLSEDVTEEELTIPKAPKAPKKSGYQNQMKLNPALYNIPNKEQMQKQLGKATEMEQAYDNVDKIIGKNNVQSISSDTKDLIKQQNELIKQLKTMTPALNDAMSSLGNLDLSKLTGMFNSATKNLAELKTDQ